MTKKEKALFDVAQYEGVTSQEMAEKLQDEVVAYTKKVKDINDYGVLTKEEKTLNEMLIENEKYLNGVTYELPSTCEFEGTTYTRDDVAEKIIYFISRNEQPWQYVLGLHQLVRAWKDSNNTAITHSALDSTLRLLEQQKFKGDTEWVDILIVNTFIVPIHEEYAKNMIVFTALSQFHNAVIEQRKLIMADGVNLAEKA